MITSSEIIYDPEFSDLSFGLSGRRYDGVWGGKNCPLHLLNEPATFVAVEDYADELIEASGGKPRLVGMALTLTSTRWVWSWLLRASEWLSGERNQELVYRRRGIVAAMQLLERHEGPIVWAHLMPHAEPRDVVIVFTPRLKRALQIKQNLSVLEYQYLDPEDLFP